MTVQTKDLTIRTAKGHSIAAVQYYAEKSANHSLIISSATGVLQKYYSKFARFFAAKGFVVYTFDYYGIGKSAGNTAQLKKNTNDLKSWGKYDQAAVVAFAKEENQAHLITLVTHSVGGQLLGFNAHHNLIDKTIMVASQSGYWKLFKGIHYFKMALLWYIIIPFLTSMFGYFPSKKMRLFENLPKHMAFEWAAWGKRKAYMMHFYNERDYYFKHVKFPILALSFSKDTFAPKKTVDWMANQYKNATVTRIHHEAKKGERHIKHFGFFKDAYQDSLWKPALNWILNDQYQ